MARVCHVTSAHGPEDVRIFQKECVTLGSAGYEVYLVEQGASYCKDGVNIVGFGKPEKKRLKRFLLGAWRAYKTARQLRCDIYHLHDPELLPYAIALKTGGATVVFDSHEFTLNQIREKTWIPVGFRAAIYKAYETFEKFVIRRIDAVVVAAPNLVSHFEGMNDHVVAVTNYPILESMVSKNENKKHNEEHLIVYAGGISDQWNLANVAAAIERIPRCTLEFCGRADEEYLSQIQTMDHEKKCRYLGTLPHEEALELLQRGDIGIALLSYGYNTDGHQGNLSNTKLFEEMMAGLPVICTDFVLWREIVDGNRCGLCIDPHDVASIREAIFWMLEHPEEAVQMGQRGREAVIREYNWSTQATKLIALYEELSNTRV